MEEKMILKDLLEKICLSGPVRFKYNDIEYSSSYPIIVDFRYDKMDILLDKKISIIYPIVTENDVALVVELVD